MHDKHEEKPDTVGKEFSDEFTPEEREHEIEARDQQA